MKSNGKDNHKQIISVMIFFVCVFLGMIGYLCHFVATNEQEMINNSYNSRQEILLAQNYRGSIFSADGEILAETLFTADGKEQRHYPYKNLFSHVIGFSTYGRTGVEEFSNYYLINSDISLRDKVSNTTAGLKNPGNNVYTTLDTKIQQAAYNALGVYEGAIIVTECATGKILAMVSKPDFDPNEIADIWEELAADEDSSVLLNRVTQGLYPPGSTFKIMSALEYIRENPDTYSDYSYQCRGSYKQDGNAIQCYHGSVHNKVSFIKSFAKSCNTSFANIGMNLDMSKFADTLEQLLFNQNIKLDFTTANSKTPISKDISTAEMLQASIGQGTVQMTPIHLNMITSAIANNGMLMKPYLVDCIKNATGTTIQSYKPKQYSRLMTEDESAVLREMMIEVVENGTATRMKGYGYTVGGKTGSAEYNSKHDSHAWFTGFAPAENPEVAITVIIEGAGAGGDYAVPMARRVLDAYFKE